MSRVLDRSTRTVWVVAGVAVLSLVVGMLVGRFVQSPAEAAASAAPPEAGAITVPVERRSLANDVVLRGDAVYDDPTDVRIETGELGGPAVVTGQVPETGSTLDAGSVTLEVTGRPVLLLPGDLPTYRTLRVGSSGPDVTQLKAALGSLGIDAGSPGDVYDAATAAGVRALYARAGYPAPSAGADAASAVELAQEGVRAAADAVAQAEQALAAARAGVPRSERIALQTAVDAAALRLGQAQAACADPAAPECDPIAVVEARGEHDQAVATRDERLAAPDTRAEASMLESARRGLSDAQQDLSDANAAAVTPLPAGEIVYVPSLPRRVDWVNVSRGSTVGSEVMTLSGATLQIQASAATTDSALIEVGAEAIITLPGGEDVPGTVTSVGPPPTSRGDGDGASGGSAGSDRDRVVIEPGELTDAQRGELQGANVRVRIPVGSTEGDVLAVPLAALTAGPGGEARVERMGDDGTTTLLTVKTGLAAGGFVEITRADGDLAEGDLVVVGVARSATTGDPDGENDDEDPEETDAEEAEATDGAG